MSQTATNHYVQQWKSTGLHVYQSKGFKMKNTTTPPEKITGEKMHFPIFGLVEAEEDFKRGDTAKPTNPNDTTVAVDTKKSKCFTEVYEDDLDQMTVNKKQAEARRSAMAMGRTHDKTVIRTLNTATQSVGAYGDLMNIEAIMKAKQKLIANDVDCEDGDVFCAMDSVSWIQFSGDKRVANSDYTGPALPYTKGGMARSWNGIHFFGVSDKILRENAGAATQSDCLMWHRSAIGFGFVRQLTGSVSWDERKDCWMHNLRMRIGSKLLLPEGAVKIQALYDPNQIALPNP